MRHRATMLIVWAGAVVAVGACAAGGRGEPRLIQWQPPAGQSCEPLRQPEHLPPASEVVDAAAVLAELGSLLAERSAGLMVSVPFDSTGAPGEPQVAEPSPDAVSESLAARVRPHLLARAEAPAHRLLLVLEADEVRVGRSEGCPPRVANPLQVGGFLEQRMADYVAGTPGAALPGRPVVLMVQVDTAGRPTEVRVEQSWGESALDQMALEAARGMRFHPARVDARPVQVWVRIPLEVGAPPTPVTRRRR